MQAGSKIAGLHLIPPMRLQDVTALAAALDHTTLLPAAHIFKHSQLQQLRRRSRDPLWVTRRFAIFTPHQHRGMQLLRQRCTVLLSVRLSHTHVKTHTMQAGVHMIEL